MGKRVIIVGGGAGGASAAAEAKRNDPSLEILIVEKGKFISFAA
ncbi:MAG TPA: NAD(P)-binding protein [Syntrophales bacterium]|nr:NAD(P)-binding protein [Syntrophales bacterium]HOL59991.1 NAD(P)-binding protein [Syntrophales bacterium]HPO36130.1 NAD(P)-binding protein [Syntrophales bacterium]